MRIDAVSVDDYLARAPAPHRDALEQVREVIRRRLPSGYQEGLQYGMISWFIPLSRYPGTYNGQPLVVASLASQKRYMALYLNGVYGDERVRRWFIEAYAASGKKLDMGKSCVRFASLDDLPLEVVGEVVGRVSVDNYLAIYEQAHAGRPVRSRKPAASARPAAKPKPKAKAGKPTPAPTSPRTPAKPATKAKASVTAKASVKARTPAKPATKAKASVKAKASIKARTPAKPATRSKPAAKAITPPASGRKRKPSRGARR